MELIYSDVTLDRSLIEENCVVILSKHIYCATVKTLLVIHILHH